MQTPRNTSSTLLSPLAFICTLEPFFASTVTSIASPGRKLSKSIFSRADSAASMESCLMSEFALNLSTFLYKRPLVRLFQLDVVRIRLDVEG